MIIKDNNIILKDENRENVKPQKIFNYYKPKEKLIPFSAYLKLQNNNDKEYNVASKRMIKVVKSIISNYLEANEIQ